MTALSCQCGKTRLEVTGPPITVSECYCTSCRTAGAHLATLPGAQSLLNANGGTPCVLQRKDRVTITEGRENLAEYRLTPEAPTRRVVATCCNTAMFLEFQNGHWLSIYSDLWPEGTQPRIELRTMTRDLPDASVLPDDGIPNAGHQTFAFMRKLLGAWIAMGFRVPKIEIDKSLEPGAVQQQY